MALVNIDTALNDVLRRLRKMNPPGGVEVLSYKRNRGVDILLNPEGTVTVRERGYVEQELVVPLDELQKTLKPIFKMEFPRSRKVRVYQVDGTGAAGTERKRL